MPDREAVEPHLAVGRSERVQEPLGIRRTGGTGYTEEDAHERRLPRPQERVGQLSESVPLDASRNAPRASRFSWPRYAYEPITVFPNAAGLVR